MIKVNGTGVFYHTNAELSDPGAVAARVLRLFGFDHAASVYRYTEEINELSLPLPDEDPEPPAMSS